MSETTQSSVLAEEKVVARVWKAINDKADPVVVREHLDALPAADRLRVADAVAEGLRERASKTGDYAEMERVLPYVPGQGPRERAAMEAAAPEPQTAPVRESRRLSEEEVKRTLAEADRMVSDSKTLEPVWKVINNPKADPADVRDILDRQSPADQERLAAQVWAGLDRRAARTGDNGTTERVAPYLPPRDTLTHDAPPPSGRVVPDASRALGPDAQTIYQAVSRLLENNPVIAVEDLKGLKQHAAQSLAAREAIDGRVELTPDIRIAAGKPPVHTLDEMREVFAAVRERAAVPSDRLAPEAVAEVRQSLQDQIVGSRSMLDLMKLYGQDDTQRAMRSLEAHPEQSRLLTEAMEATGKRLLAEDRVKLGLDEPAATRRSLTSPSFDAPADGAPVRPGVRGMAADAESPAPFSISRRGDNAAPAAPERVREPPAIARDYEVREKGDERHYHRRDDGKLAIRATETHIHGVRRDASTIGAMLDLAAARGWNDVQVRGDRDVAREVWIEANVRGMRAEGYQPTRDDRHAVEQRRIERREQGLDAPAASPAPAPGVRARAADAPERRQTPAEARDGDGEFGGGMTPRAAAASRAERERHDRNAWTTGTGGFGALSERQQQHAEQAYEKWAAMNPDRTFDLRGYVSHVQEKQAERREAREARGRDRAPERDRDDERQPHMPAPRKIEMPGRSLGL